MLTPQIENFGMWVARLRSAAHNPQKSGIAAGVTTETHGRDGIPRHVPAPLLK
jgi:hypothetical protein